MKFTSIFYILFQHFLQYFASISFSVLQFPHFLLLLFIFIILVDSINIITVIVDKIVTNIGQRIISIPAIIFQAKLIGTISQYHVVVIVTTAHQNVFGIELNVVAFHQFCSEIYTRVENNTRIITITNSAVIYSTLWLFIHFHILVTIGILSTNSNILNTLNSLNIVKNEYNQIQYIAIKMKNGRNDNKSRIFIIRKGNLPLWLEYFHLYKYSNKNTVDIIKSVIKISNQYFLSNPGRVSSHTITTDNNIKNIII